MEDHNLNTIEKQVALTAPMFSEIPQNPVIDIELKLRNLLQNGQNIKQSEELLLSSISDIIKSFEEIKPFLKIWGKYKNQLLEIMASEESTEEVIKRYYEYPEIQKTLKENQEILHKKEEELQNWSESILNQELNVSRKANEEYQRKLNETLDNLQTAVQNKSIAEEKQRQMEVEIDRLKESNNRLSNENSSIKERLETAIEKYEEKVEFASRLQEDLKVYKSFRGLVADAFKINANSEKEFSLALQTTKKILFACVEYTRDKQYDIQESFEDLIKKFNTLQTQIIDNKKLKDELASNQIKIKEQDLKLYDYEVKNRRQLTELEVRGREIENKENEIKKIKENDELVNKKYQELIDKTNLYSRIISIFTSIDNNLETQVNAILINGNQYDNLNFISEFINQIVVKYNRLIEIDRITQQYELPELSALSLQQILAKYLGYDTIKQNHDLYEHFIKELFIIQGNMQVISFNLEQKTDALNSFIRDYSRILALCQYFDASGDAEGSSLDRWESHQAQMNKSIDDFYQSVSQLKDFSENTGITAYDKISALPLVQKKINQALRAAIFSIDFSRKSVEESNSMHTAIHELQLKLEKATHVLEVLEKKLYPKFLTSGIEGRRDRLIKDIEAGLEFENPDALALKSYLGLLRFVESSSPEDIGEDTLIWILEKLPISLYNFYQDVILDNSNDIKTNEEIYGIMQQLMNKINKNILHGELFLGMPRLKDGINLDSMVLDTDEQPNVVNAVVSWRISNSKHQIKSKARVR